MLETIRNAWKIVDLRKKILFTVLIIFLFRIGSVIPVPFINTELLKAVFDETMSGGLFGFVNIMSGGAFSQATLFAMSITPYINASIIIQLLTIGIPAMERIVKEGGEEGQKKQAAWTRYATIIIALIQGWAYYTTLKVTKVTETNQTLLTSEGNSILGMIVIILVFCAGSALIMWFGEQITEKGIGNGISMILFAGIVSRGPALVLGLVASYFSALEFIPILTGLLYIAAAVAVVGFVVWITNAERRLPVQYAKRVVGRKVYGGQSTFIPLKVNMTGVLPIIFASAICSIPMTINGFINGGNPPAGGFWKVFMDLFNYTSPVYAVLYFLLIIGFSYFYASIQFNPIEIANNLKKNGGFIMGLRPGRPTSDFIVKVMNKVIFIGALFLGLIATLPIIVGAIIKGGNIALGGTSLLIIVGVALETVTAMEAQMMMRHHKGFLD